MAEVEELKANPDTEASGIVIESKLDPGRGAVVTVLVQRGTLKIGDALVAGAHWGRVRAMHDYTGKRVKDGAAGEPVEVLGFDTVPEAGEYVRVVENDRKARPLAGERANRLKLEPQARRGGIKRSLATIFDQRGDVKELNLVLKADVSGSLEAFEDEIAKLPQDEVSVYDRARRRRRHHRVRRQPGRRVGRDHPRLQRPPGRRGAPAGRPRGRRDPHLLGHLPRDRRAARRHAGHARAGDGRGRRRQRSRSAQIFRASKIGVDRRLHGHRRQGHARRQGAPRSATARSSTTARSARCGASTTTCARSPTGFECGVVLANYAERQGGRHDGGLRDPAGRAHALLGRGRERAYVVAAARPPALPRGRLAEGQASRARTA